MAVGRAILSSLLLFSLVFGMSATVDMGRLRKQLQNRHALLTGAFLQFVILPFLGFVVVKLLRFDHPMGVTLLVLTSSPGGSYSNWWCSMFNADLALSVTMTTISTLLSIVMLPLNLYIYTTYSYEGEVIKNLDWTSLFASIILVIGAVTAGLICSARVKSYKFNRRANALGNVAGLGLILFSILVSKSDDVNGNITGRDYNFYFGVASPCIFGLLISNLLTSYFKLSKPERVSVSVECCYQNVGIATSVAIAMFNGIELGEAIDVPLYYGMVEALLLGLYCIVAWKYGWTKAPRNEWIWVVLANSYEVDEMEYRQPDESIEVILGSNIKGVQRDVIFVTDQNDNHIVDSGNLNTLQEISEELEKEEGGKKKVTWDISPTNNPARRFPLQLSNDSENETNLV